MKHGRFIPILQIYLEENTIIKIYLYSHFKITSVLFVMYRNRAHVSHLPTLHSVTGPAKQGNFHFAKES